MPITYEQAGPFSPGISSAYGAAEQFSRDAPTIAGIAEHAASLQQQGLGRADQLRFAYAQANAQAQNEQANRYAVSQAANANREQQGLDISAQLEAQANANMLHANTQLAAQQQGAQLQAWLGQQDLSQKEVMRLQQMRGAIADVQASNLPDDEKQNQILKLQTGIDPLEQRLKAQQARTLQSTADLHEQQTKLEVQKVAEMAKVNAMTAEQRVFTQLTPEAQAEIDAMDLTPQERDAAVKAAKASGKYNTFTIGPTGELKHVDAKSSHADFEQKRYDAESKFFLQREQKWEEDYVKAQDRVRKHLIEGNPDEKTPDLERIQELAKKEMRPRPTPPAPMQPYGSRASQPAPAPTPEATPTTEPPKGAVAVLDNAAATFNARPDVAPDAKLEVNTMIDKAKAMIANPKGYNGLSEADKKIYDEYERRVEQAIKNPPKARTSPLQRPYGFEDSMLRPWGFKGQFPGSRGPMAGGQAFFGAGAANAGVPAPQPAPEVVE